MKNNALVCLEKLTASELKFQTFSIYHQVLLNIPLKCLNFMNQKWWIIQNQKILKMKMCSIALSNKCSQMSKKSKIQISQLQIVLLEDYTNKKNKKMKMKMNS